MASTFLMSPLALLGIVLSLGRWLRRLELGHAVFALSRRDRVPLAACVAATAVVLGWKLWHAPAFVEDEGTYTAQAWAVLHGHVTPYFYTYDHPPLAWLQLAPFLGLLHVLHIGSNPVESLRLVMAALVLLDVVLLYVIARRTGMSAGVVGAALFLLVASPLTQDYLLRVYIDNVALPWLLVAVAVAVAPAGRRNGWLVGVSMGMALLSKETMLLVWPAVAIAVYTYAEPTRRWSEVRELCATTAVVGLLYPAWAYYRGQTGVLWDAVTYQLLRRAGSGSPFEPGSARHTIIQHWLDLDTVLIAVGVVCAVLALVDRRFRWIGVAALLPLVQVLRPSGYLPYMAVIVVLPFFALAAGASATLVLESLKTSLAWARLGAERRPSFAAAGLALLLLPALGSKTLLHDDPVEHGRAATSAVDQAISWTAEHTPEGSRILADDVVFAALQTRGREDPWRQVVYVYKLDYDPQARTRVPGGWRGIDYVVDTPMLLGSINPEMTQAAAARAHSRVIAGFGTGRDRVEIRQVLSEDDSDTSAEAVGKGPDDAQPPAPGLSRADAQARLDALVAQFAYETDTTKRRGLLEQMEPLKAVPGVIVPYR